MMSHSDAKRSVIREPRAIGSRKRKPSPQVTAGFSNYLEEFYSLMILVAIDGLGFAQPKHEVRERNTTSCAAAATCFAVCTRQVGSCWVRTECVESAAVDILAQIVTSCMKSFKPPFESTHAIGIAHVSTYTTKHKSIRET